MDLWSLLKLSFNEWMVILATSESPFRPFWRVEREEKTRVVSENVRAIHSPYLHYSLSHWETRVAFLLSLLLFLIILAFQMKRCECNKRRALHTHTHILTMFDYNSTTATREMTTSFKKAKQDTRGEPHGPRSSFKWCAKHGERKRERKHFARQKKKKRGSPLSLFSGCCRRAQFTIAFTFYQPLVAHTHV